MDESNMDMLQSYYDRGLELELAGDYAGAIAEFEKIVKAGVVHAELFRRLGICLSELERYPDAIRAIRKSIDLAPKDPLVHVDLGYIYYKLGMKNQAVVEYEQALEIAPGFVDVYITLIQICRELNRLDDALSFVKEVFEIDPSDPRIHYQYASICAAQGRMLDALSAYQQTEELAGESDLKKLAHDAIIDLQNSVAPSTVEQRTAALEVLSEIPQEHEDDGFKKTIEILLRACALDPFFINIQKELAETYLKAGLAGDAKDIFGRIVDKHPDDQIALLGLARSHIAMAHFQDAKPLLQRVNQIDPRNYPGKFAREQLAVIAVQEQYGVVPVRNFEEAMAIAKSDLKRAIELMVNAVALAPDVGLFHCELGWFYIFTGDEHLGQAFRQFQLAIDCDPGEGRYYGGLGTVLLQQGKIDEAVPALQRAVDLDPDNAESHNALGACYLASKDLPLAEIEFRKATMLAPYEFGGWKNLYETLVDENKLEQAVSELERLLEVVPDAEFAPDVEKFLISAKERQDELIQQYSVRLAVSETASQGLSETAARLCEEGARLARSGFVERAIERYQAALSESFEAFTPHFLLGNAYARIQQHNEAIREYKFAVVNQASAEEIADAYFNMGNSYYDLNEIDQAVTCYQNAIDAYPDIYDARARMASCFEMQKQYQDAISMVRAEIELRSRTGAPAISGLHISLAQLLICVERTTEALFEFKKSIAVEPNFALGYELLGDTLISKELGHLAQMECEKALELEPADEEARGVVKLNRFAQYEYSNSAADEARVRFSINRKKEQLLKDTGSAARSIEFVHHQDGTVERRRKSKG